jgi:hypothetical protein
MKKYFFILKLIFIPLIFTVITACSTIVDLFYKIVNIKIVDANNIVLAVQGNENNMYCYIYKENDVIVIETVKHIYENGIIKEELIGRVGVNNLKITDEYSINIIKDEIFIYNDNKIYIIKLEINERQNRNEQVGNYINPKIVIDVENIHFYNNTCFYIDSNKKIFIYDNNRKSFSSYNNIVLPEDFNYIQIYKPDIISRIINNHAEEWYNNWVESFVNKIRNNNVDNIINNIDQRDKKYLNRYYGCIPKTRRKISLDMWRNDDYKTLENKKNEDIENRYRYYINKWGIKPWEEETFFIVKYNTLINRNDEINDNNYLGKNVRIKKYIEYLDEIIKTYKELENLNASNETKNMYRQFYTNIIDEINSIENEDLRQLRIDKESYRNEINRIEEKFYSDLASRLKNIEFIDINENENNSEINIINIPNNDKPEYMLVCIKMSEPQINNEFKKTGQCIYSMNIMDNYIVVANDNKLSFYDIFTLEELDIKKERVKTENENIENILFFLSTDNNIIITENKYNHRYFVRNLEINNNKYEIKKLNMDIKSNDIIEKNDMKIYTNSSNAPFYSIYLKLPEEYVYINLKKSTVNERLIIDGNLIYKETPTGAGIILKRSR